LELQPFTGRSRDLAVVCIFSIPAESGQSEKNLVRAIQTSVARGFRAHAGHVLFNLDEVGFVEKINGD
jgi:hypothetical protein